MAQEIMFHDFDDMFWQWIGTHTKVVYIWCFDIVHMAVQLEL